MARAPIPPAKPTDPAGGRRSRAQVSLLSSVGCERRPRTRRAPTGPPLPRPHPGRVRLPGSLQGARQARPAAL